MKTMILAIGILALVAGPASAQYTGYRGYQGYGGYGTGSNPTGVYHQGYTNHGTYVQPHYQSAPNTTQYDNWSTRGNINPYTGQMGHRTPQW